MDNVQKHNICINVPSSQNFRSYWSVLLPIWVEPRLQLQGYYRSHDRLENFSLHLFYICLASDWLTVWKGMLRAYIRHEMDL
jgi:hypothetical protein